MSRVIKFRMFDNEDKVMVKLDNVTFDSEGRWLLGDSRCLEFTKDDGELMQFTGLLDKNGREIYEGDIVRLDSFNNPSIFEVRFIEGAFCLWNKSVPYATDIHYVQHAGINQATIIGNIHENPELLKGGES